MKALRSIMLSLILLGALSACQDTQDIKIGFAGCLTGKLSDLGTQGRDAVLLAAESINARGGINGRKVEFLVRDDAQDAATAIKADQELSRAGVVAIIGHMTSAMSLATLKTIEEEGVVLFSPTSTSNQLHGIDDWFVRTALSDRTQSTQMATYAAGKGYQRIAIIQDTSNQSFSEPWALQFKEGFEAAGASIIALESFTSAPDFDYAAAARSLQASQPDAILLIAGALDTALFSQQLRKQGFTGQLFSSGWAKTQDLISNGGIAVEGLVLPQTHDQTYPGAAWQEFRQRFMDRYQREPNFAAAGAWDCATILFAVLAESTDRAEIRRRLCADKTWPVLQGSVTIDAMGDANRPTFLFSIKNGEYINISPALVQ